VGLPEAAMGYWKLPWTYHGAARSCHGAYWKLPWAIGSCHRHTWKLPWSYLGAIIEVWGATIELPEATCAGTVFMGTGVGMTKYTQGLPVSLPIHNICSVILEYPMKIMNEWCLKTIQGKPDYLHQSGPNRAVV
jgi:hypothetical protein